MVFQFRRISAFSIEYLSLRILEDIVERIDFIHAQTGACVGQIENTFRYGAVRVNGVLVDHRSIRTSLGKLEGLVPVILADIVTNCSPRVGITSHDQHKAAFIIMAVIVLHDGIGGGVIAVQPLAVLYTVRIIGFIILNHRISRLKWPDSYIIARVLVTAVAHQIVFNQGPIGIPHCNSVAADLFHIIVSHHHIGGRIPVHRNSRRILLPLVTPGSADKLDSRSVHTFKGTAGDQHIVVSARNSGQLSAPDIRLYIEENTSVPFKVNIAVDIVNVAVRNRYTGRRSEILDGHVYSPQSL